MKKMKFTILNIISILFLNTVVFAMEGKESEKFRGQWVPGDSEEYRKYLQEHHWTMNKALLLDFMKKGELGAYITFMESEKSNPTKQLEIADYIFKRFAFNTKTYTYNISAIKAVISTYSDHNQDEKLLQSIKSLNNYNEFKIKKIKKEDAEPTEKEKNGQKRLKCDKIDELHQMYKRATRSLLIFSGFSLNACGLQYSIFTPVNMVLQRKGVEILEKINMNYEMWMSLQYKLLVEGIVLIYEEDDYDYIFRKYKIIIEKETLKQYLFSAVKKKMD